MITTFICAGRVAISIGILSYAEKIQFSILSDTCVDADPKDLRDRFQEALDELIRLGEKREAVMQAVKDEDSPLNDSTAEGNPASLKKKQ